jgi:aldose 1-epimerase
VPPPYETEDVLFQGYPALALHDRQAAISAVFTPRIGMLGCSLEHDGEELLGHRAGLARYEATGSTMGIPVLHPWANRLSGFSYAAGGRAVELDPESPLIRTDANGLPIHGLVNASPYWDILGTVADESSARISAQLDFNAHPELLEAFPYPHELRIDATMRDSTLTIRTTLAATGDTVVPVSFGFHPYLVLPGVPRAEWHIEVPLRRRLVLDERSIPTGEVEDVEIAPGPLGDATYDDGFADVPDGARFVLSGGGRRLTVEFAGGYRFAQIYAPDSEDVICFEPMTAPTNALVNGRDLPLVAPGETRSATFAISVERA